MRPRPGRPGRSDHARGDVEDAHGWGEWTDVDATVERETVERAVRESLEPLLPTLATLLSDLVGRTVVTSDHGTMHGERAWPVPFREWGHPPGLSTEELLTVPWLVSVFCERRRISQDGPEVTVGVGEMLTEERLAELGSIWTPGLPVSRPGPSALPEGLRRPTALGVHRSAASGRELRGSRER